MWFNSGPWDGKIILGSPGVPNIIATVSKRWERKAEETKEKAWQWKPRSVIISLEDPIVSSFWRSNLFSTVSLYTVHFTLTAITITAVDETVWLFD